MPSIHDKGKSRAIEVLDVEDADSRHARLGSILEKLNSGAHPDGTPVPSRPTQFDFGDRRTYAVEPPSELLARVQAFLPQLEAANADTVQRAQLDPDALDIENVDPNQEQYIEMNLGLGVFEDRTKLGGHPTSLDEESSEDGEQDEAMASEDSDTSTSGESSDEDPDEDSDSIISSIMPSRPIKPLPKRRARPNILMLEEHPDAKATVP